MERGSGRQSSGLRMERGSGRQCGLVQDGEGEWSTVRVD